MNTICDFKQFNEGLYGDIKSAFFGSMNKKEPINIAIKYYKGVNHEYSFLDNKIINKVSVKLISIISNKYNLNLNRKSNIIPLDMIEVLTKYFTELGLVLKTVKNKSYTYYFFTNDLSLNDLK
jgi:hypothetical protein